MSILATLHPEQRKAIGLLQIGTFLEYFDLMLYVHMGVFLTELFFPTSDAHTASLVAAATFCSTYLLRPIGALVFGYIGDHIGRKSTIIITTGMMAISCLVMANVPTYAQAGILASWIVTICRIMQGMSSMGEIIGAQVFLSELFRPPLRYVAVALVGLASSVGGMAALGVASLVTSYDFNWRLAFWAGSFIAIITVLYRTALRETPEYLNAKNKKLQNNNIAIPKVSKKSCLLYFFVEMGQPLTFFLSYIYAGQMLKSLGCSPASIIHQNFFVALVSTISSLVLAIWCIRTHPLRILRLKIKYWLFLLPLLPFLMTNAQKPYQVFFIQCLIAIFALKTYPADAIFIRFFPTLKRFTVNTFIYAMSRLVAHVILAFGMIYLSEWFGHYGIWFVAVPIFIGFTLGVNHFEPLEKKQLEEELIEIRSRSTQDNVSQKVVC